MCSVHRTVVNKLQDLVFLIVSVWPEKEPRKKNWPISSISMSKRMPIRPSGRIRVGVREYFLALLSFSLVVKSLEEPRGIERGGGEGRVAEVRG